MLATALIEDGRAKEARVYLEQAVEIARALPSPVGEMRALYALGRMHEALGEISEALKNYRRAGELATELGVASIQEAARDGVMRTTVKSPG